VGPIFLLLSSFLRIEILNYCAYAQCEYGEREEGEKEWEERGRSERGRGAGKRGEGHDVWCKFSLNERCTLRWR
jgi:hypothetical protein